MITSPDNAINRGPTQAGSKFLLISMFVTQGIILSLGPEKVLFEKVGLARFDNIVSVGVHWYEVDNTTTQDLVLQISFKFPHHSCFNTSVHLLGITSHRQ